MSVLIAYSVALFLASWVGGWLPRRFKLSHTQTQLVMSLVAGLMLGVAGFHLIPHSAQQGGSVDITMYWVIGGLVFMLLYSDFSLPPARYRAGGGDCEHHDEHDHASAHDHAHPPQEIAWLGLFVGLSVHAILDGIALGAVLRVELDASLLPGLGVLVAILLHKPLDALSIETLMRLDGWSESSRRAINTGFSLITPLAALLFFLGFSGPIDTVVPAALAFSAGAFICIALADLLPEVQFHSHDRFKLSLSFAVGLALALALGLVEPHYHH